MTFPFQRSHHSMVPSPPPQEEQLRVTVVHFVRRRRTQPLGMCIALGGHVQQLCPYFSCSLVQVKLSSLALLQLYLAEPMQNHGHSQLTVSVVTTSACCTSASRDECAIISSKRLHLNSCHDMNPEALTCQIKGQLTLPQHASTSCSYHNVDVMYS
jgi:hypothetical protein